MKKSSRNKKAPKRVLRLPDLDYAKGAVLNTLGSPESKRAHLSAGHHAAECACRTILQAGRLRRVPKNGFGATSKPIETFARGAATSGYHWDAEDRVPRCSWSAAMPTRSPASKAMPHTDSAGTPAGGGVAGALPGVYRMAKAL